LSNLGDGELVIILAVILVFVIIMGVRLIYGRYSPPRPSAYPHVGSALDGTAWRRRLTVLAEIAGIIGAVAAIIALFRR
jgi:hypothetical protein